MRLQYLLEWTDCVEQTADVLKAGFGKDCGVLCTDEPLVREGAGVLAYRVDAQLSRYADGFVAGPALMDAPVLAAEQIGVHP